MTQLLSASLALGALINFAGAIRFMRSPAQAAASMGLSVEAEGAPAATEAALTFVRLCGVMVLTLAIFYAVTALAPMVLIVNVGLAGLTLLIRGKRPGENPSKPVAMQDFKNYSSHNEYGTDHFGFTYYGDLRAYCEALRAEGVTFAVEPWEIAPGSLICYIAAPDGVSIELVQAHS